MAAQWRFTANGQISLYDPNKGRRIQTLEGSFDAWMGCYFPRTARLWPGMYSHYTVQPVLKPKASTAI